MKTEQGIANLSNEHASTIAGDDRKSAQRHLYESIESQRFSTRRLFGQIVSELHTETYSLNAFELTKVWQH